MPAYIYILIFFSIFILIELITVIRVLAKNLPTVKRIKITFRINLVIFFTGLLMLLASALFDINYLQYEAPIPHSEWQKISFRDFRGLNRPDQTLDGMNEFAFVVTEMRVKEKNNEIDVTSYFHPSRSYVYSDVLDNDKLLTHEMYHFHINEYICRLFRKEIADLKGVVSIKELKNKYLRLENQWQRNYDDDSYHSYVLGKQLAWQKKVDSCLLATKKYEDPIVIIK